jgi:hypothetical protein
MGAGALLPARAAVLAVRAGGLVADGLAGAATAGPPSARRRAARALMPAASRRASAWRCTAPPQRSVTISHVP